MEFLKVSGSPKVFGWRVLLDRLPFRVNPERRGVGVDCNLCLLCHKEDETIQYRFITCEVAHRLWTKCDNWLGIISVRSNDVDSQFCGFTLNHPGVKKNFVWRGMWLTLVKEIWIHRNRLIFNN